RAAAKERAPAALGSTRADRAEDDRPAYLDDGSVPALRRPDAQGLGADDGPAGELDAHAVRHEQPDPAAQHAGADADVPALQERLAQIDLQRPEERHDREPGRHHPPALAAYRAEQRVERAGIQA